MVLIWCSWESHFVALLIKNIEIYFFLSIYKQGCRSSSLERVISNAVGTILGENTEEVLYIKSTYRCGSLQYSKLVLSAIFSFSDIFRFSSVSSSFLRPSRFKVCRSSSLTLMFSGLFMFFKFQVFWWFFR